MRVQPVLNTLKMAVLSEELFGHQWGTGGGDDVKKANITISQLKECKTLLSLDVALTVLQFCTVQDSLWQYSGNIMYRQFLPPLGWMLYCLSYGTLMVSVPFFI